MLVTVYYDYRCGYSFRAMRWFAMLPDVAVDWRTFSLAEINRADDEPSHFGEDPPESISVVALALAHAARDADFDAYHRSLFEAWHGSGPKLDLEDIRAFAGKAGIDLAAFDADSRRFVKAAAIEHEGARLMYGVFGTPTIIFPDGGAVYVRLAEVPRTDAIAMDIWNQAGSFASGFPALHEFKRPLPPDPEFCEVPNR